MNDSTRVVTSSAPRIGICTPARWTEKRRNFPLPSLDQDFRSGHIRETAHEHHPDQRPEEARHPRPAASASAAAKRRALSLHIGLNKVDPGHYAGWDGELFACEADAADMQAPGAVEGMKPTVLIGAQASRAAVLKALRAASALLKSATISC